MYIVLEPSVVHSVPWLYTMTSATDAMVHNVSLANSDRQTDRHVDYQEQYIEA